MDEEFFTQVSENIRRDGNFTEKNGWFAASTVTRLRQLMMECVRRVLLDFIRKLDTDEIESTAMNTAVAINDSPINNKTPLVKTNESAYFSSSRHEWYERYCNITDSIATRNELEEEKRIVSLVASKSAPIINRKRRKKSTSTGMRKRSRRIGNLLDSVERQETEDVSTKKTQSSLNSNPLTNAGSKEFPNIDIGTRLDDFEAFSVFDENLDSESDQSGSMIYESSNSDSNSAEFEISEESREESIDSFDEEESETESLDGSGPISCKAGIKISENKATSNQDDSLKRQPVSDTNFQERDVDDKTTQRSPQSSVFCEQSNMEIFRI